MISTLRFHIGRTLFLWGFFILPKNLRAEVSKIINVGHTWAKHGKPEEFWMSVKPNVD
jgi:hypothetical protein